MTQEMKKKIEKENKRAERKECERSDPEPGHLVDQVD